MPDLIGHLDSEVRRRLAKMADDRDEVRDETVAEEPSPPTPIPGVVETYRRAPVVITEARPSWWRRLLRALRIVRR